ncbi:hypothetical protein RIF29_41177 [Crotalaria pallida]|uniref:Uncharacterized protein n=1 Tax=Crotalaria pallida TaxID=3830 RepID=A0AAN9E4H5_CROPI
MRRKTEEEGDPRSCVCLSLLAYSSKLPIQLCNLLTHVVGMQLCFFFIPISFKHFLFQVYRPRPEGLSSIEKGYYRHLRLKYQLIYNIPSKKTLAELNPLSLSAILGFVC